MKKLRYYITIYTIKKSKLIDYFYNFIKNFFTYSLLFNFNLYLKLVYFLMKNKKSKRSKISTITKKWSCSAIIALIVMKIHLQLDSDQLNIIQLIIKVELL